MSFLIRLLIVTLLAARSCIPVNQEDFIILTLKSIAARQDSLLQKFDVLADKLLAQHEVLEDKLLAQHEELENLTPLIGRCSTKHNFQDLLATVLEDKLLAQHEVVDECRPRGLQASSSCGGNPTCQYDEGNFTCQCQQGFIGNPYTQCSPFVCASPSLDLQPFGCITLQDSMSWSDAQAKCNSVGGSLLHGFNTPQQLLTISQHVRQHFGYRCEDLWIGVRGGFFVKSPFDDRPSGRSSPGPLFWKREHPEFRDCGCLNVYLSEQGHPPVYSKSCGENQCSLCQIRY